MRLFLSSANSETCALASIRRANIVKGFVDNARPRAGRGLTRNRQLTINSNVAYKHITNAIRDRFDNCANPQTY